MLCVFFFCLEQLHMGWVVCGLPEGDIYSDEKVEWLIGMATHSSVPAWRIPGTGEPGGLPSMESHRVGHDFSDLAAAAAAAADILYK